MMEAASTSETSVNFYQTTRRNNLKTSSHLKSLKTAMGNVTVKGGIVFSADNFYVASFCF
jgi:hypothetical protein